MSSLALVQSLHENLSKHVGVRNVFGDAVTAGDKTILPVARLAYGFGGGAGSGGAGERNKGEGGGGGGGARMNPVGVFVIGPQESRFIAAHDRKRTLALLAAGAGLGIIFARRRRAPSLPGAGLRWLLRR
jgi:uncharacterized spore protein YtfJ